MHFIEDRSCTLGYQPDERCATCQLYQSDWQAPTEKLVTWLALFGMDITSHPVQLGGTRLGSPAVARNPRSPREADDR